MLFAATAVVATLMMIFALHHGEYVYAHRTFMLAMFLSFLPMAFFSYRELTGTARPVDLFTSDHPVLVKGIHLDPGNAIYLMIQASGGAASLVSASWCEATVDALEKAEEKAKKNHVGVTVDLNKLATQPCMDSNDQSGQPAGNRRNGISQHDDQDDSPFRPEPVHPYPLKTY